MINEKMKLKNVPFPGTFFLKALIMEIKAEMDSVILIFSYTTT
jgi:hypothetical protein